MAEEQTNTQKKKPTFKRNDWHKKIKLGRGVKKNQKWRGAKGIHSKVRLNRKGHPQRPRIGWGNEQEQKGKVNGYETVRIETISNLETVPKGAGIIIARVGKKKREEIITKAKAMKLQILNRYKGETNATR